MSQNVIQRIEERFDHLTKSEKVVANYLIGNPGALLLENAGDIALSAGVSPMTVTRFFRKLGFEGNVEVKKLIRTDAGHPKRRAMWSVSDRFAAASVAEGSHQQSLELEIAGMRRAYDLVQTPLWTELVTMVAEKPRVFVHGLQITRGLATELAYRLEYIRPRVVLSDGHNGTFTEILMDDPKECCAILIDIHRYSKATRDLAQMMTEAGIPFFVVTDDYCHWARDLTDRVFSLPTATELFWHSTAVMGVLLNLLVNDVVVHLGPKARKHIEQVVKNQNGFGQFLDAAR